MSAGPLAIIRQMSTHVSRGSAGEYQADEQAGIEGLSRRVSGTGAGRCPGAQIASNQQMNRQVSRGSAVDFQADDLAGVPRLSCRFSSR